MIYAKAQKESRDFYEVLDYYLELIRKLHLRTYEYLGEMRASTNPLAYCEGGLLRRAPRHSRQDQAAAGKRHGVLRHHCAQRAAASCTTTSRSLRMVALRLR